MRLPFLAVRTHSAEQTTALGRRIGEILRPGEVLLLVGDLGTGKTTFVQGLALGLGIERRPRSPTFTIVHTYEGGRYPLVHADLYRTDNTTEVLSIGLEELIQPPAVAAVEWGEKAEPVVGGDYLELDFTWEDDDGDARTIKFAPVGRWQQRTADLSAAVRTWATAAQGTA